MEALKRKRKQQRRDFTISADAFQQCIDANAEDIEISFATLSEAADALFITEESLRNKWVEQESFDEEEYEKDQDKYCEYRKRWVTCRTLYSKILKQNSDKNSCSLKTANQNKSSCSESDDDGNKKTRRFKLPKLELAKFDGDIKNWLQFWGQFKKIHDDSSLDEDDKFQYLLQSMSQNSSARQLVESYPPCGKNYSKAIDALKSRFARDELLIETYVRGLQNIVLTQAKSQTADIRTLYDKLQTHLQALESLGVTKDKYAAMLFPMVESALPEDILRAWNRNRSVIKNPEMDELSNLLRFLRQEVESEERIEIARVDNLVTSTKPPTMACLTTATPSTSRAAANNQKNDKSAITCVWCDKQSHSSSECHKAGKMSFEERTEFLKKKKACLICLKIGHWAKKCKSFPKCLYCQKRHVTLMCSKLAKCSEENNDKLSEKQEVLLYKKGTTTLLQTLIVELFNNEKSVTVRALIDSGAQRSFIKHNVAKAINLEPIGKENMSHGVFGGKQTKNEEHLIYAANIRSLDKQFCTQITVIEEKKICGYIPKVKDNNLVTKLKQRGIVLTETDDCPDDISLLIGADFCGFLLTGDVIQLENNLTAVKTKLGWTLQGVTVGSYNNVNTLFCTSKVKISDLWNLETLGIKDPAEQKQRSDRDQQVLDSFKQTIQVNEEGRYEVHLPWRDMPRPQTNYDLACKRLESTTKRLQHIGKIEAYDAVFQEWLNMGIIEQDPTANISGHYLAHHAVIKENSLTTKVRPVFDASAKDKYGISLNSCLEKGTNLLELIPKLLIGFRKEAIGITSDIAKAFLQISLAPEDREYLKFLWWCDPNAKDKVLITYRHKRVVFGVTSSPFHLVATIAHHLDNCPQHLSETAMKLKESFYIDNCVTSVKSVEQMNKFIKEAKEIMLKGMFDLRCWLTAPERVDEKIQTSSVLGVLWNTDEDDLCCNVSTLKVLEAKFTKRNILSMTQKIFDPIGMCSPTTIVPKMLIQKLWLRKLGWDDELPSDLCAEYKIWLKHVDLISNIKIPRRLTRFDISQCENSIHVFCDSSQHAYAACVFLRSKYEDDVNVTLVAAKSRVTPVKKITIPRLELIAALMGVRLCNTVMEALNLQNVKTVYWTDSSVTLSWIKGDGDWSVFVSNRVREIKKLSSVNDWNHIPGHLNPADLPSRGINAKGLLESRWWNGPLWLQLDEDRWPITDFATDTAIVDSERKKEIISTVVTTTEYLVDRLTYFSSFTKIVRMIGWMLRFGRKHFSNETELTFNEIEYAEMVLVKLIQQKHFSKLQGGCKLHTFLDPNGILRLKTKLELGDDEFSYKCPIVLHSSEPIVQRLVEERHKKLQHTGTETLIVNLRETYWVIGIRRLARKVLNNCMKCKRYKAKPCQTPSIGLPVDRITRGKAFEVTGIDLAGPLELRSGEKCWIVLFTCAVYRAIHLELVMSLSTEAFTMALRRFIARRGRVRIIYTDNGTNFVGTRNKLKTVDYEQLMVRTSFHKIEWRFIPPGAPWWGGWWERLVGVVKGILRRVLGRASLGYVELETVIFDCESVVNSRPLTYVPGDDENIKPLTPAMFIQPLPSNDVTDLDHIDEKGLNIRFKYLLKLRQDLQQRFRNEYLSTLVQKGKEGKSRLNVGDVVLVETQSKRVDWPLGLVVEMIAGSDGVCRVARVRTKNSELVRPIQRLYPLELSAADSVTRLGLDSADLEPVPKCQSTDTSNSDGSQYTTDDSKVDCTHPLPKTTRSGRVVNLPHRFCD